MTLKHVVAHDAHLPELPGTRAAGRDRGLKIFESRQPVIIHAEKRGRFAPPAAQKFSPAQNG